MTAAALEAAAHAAAVTAKTAFKMITCLSATQAAILFLVPAFAMQNAFMRIFRLPLIERGLREPTAYARSFDKFVRIIN